MLELIKVVSQNDLGIDNLLKQSEDEGYSLVKRLYDEYMDGSNTFSLDNEMLLVAQNEYGIILGVGGVQVDPYAQDPSIGRIRHFYVSPAYRRMGVGKSILEALCEFGKLHYQKLRVRVPVGTPLKINKSYYSVE